MRRIAILCSIVFVLMGTPERSLPFSGRLTDGADMPITGTRAVIFSIYDTETAGTPLWVDTMNVDILGGAFDVTLGDGDGDGIIDKPIALPFGTRYYVEMTLSGEAMTPRLPLETSAYAHRAVYADTALYAEGDMTSSSTHLTVVTDQLHICAGEVLYLNARISGPPPHTHEWTGDTSPLSATDIANPLFTTISSGVYNLTHTMTDGDGNQAIETITINVPPIVDPILSAFPSSGGCQGEPVTLMVGDCFEKYCWNAMNNNGRFCEVDTPGTYSVTATDRYGCTSSSSITVSFLPSPVANAGSNISACSGAEDPTLSGSASGGTPPYTYEWTGTGLPFLSSTMSPSPTFNVAIASPGVYHLSLAVTDANGCRDEDGPITITIYSNPTVTASSNSPVCIGSEIRLTSSPSGGGGSYLYSWTGPDGFTSSVQNPVISGATVDNAGTYTVTVTDLHGCSSTEASTDITMLHLPEVTANPTSATVCIGDPATFTAGGTGDGTAYQWQVNTGGGFANISGETGASLTITSADYAMDGNQYRCVISGSCDPDAVTTAATLMVRPPIAISAHPTDATTCEGESASFSLTATGYSLTYQWQQNTGSGWSNISGETGSTLNITPPDTDSDGYQYRCAITDGCGETVYSDPATLTVDGLPEITANPSDISVSEGDDATFTVTATGAGLTYQWQRNEGSGWVNVTGATGTSHTQTSTTGSMDGWQYRCIVSGDCEPPDTSLAATLTINSGLFDFTSHTFTNCGQTGHTGPSLSSCRSTYTTTWDENPSFFNMSTNGIQRWTVPITGNYRITAAGAEGGGESDGGQGAIMAGTFSLTEGDIIQIAVGQMGLAETYEGNSAGGGGGGSFVVTSSGTAMIVAGGGGGAGAPGNVGGNAITTQTGTHTGSAGNGGSVAEGNSGAGFTGNGLLGAHGGTAIAYSFVNGCVGGIGDSDGGTGYGGFGGGGGDGHYDGGGGGGYSGGDSGNNTIQGYGAGSYNSGTDQSNTVGNTGHGYVTVEFLD